MGLKKRMLLGWFEIRKITLIKFFLKGTSVKSSFCPCRGSEFIKNNYESINGARYNLIRFKVSLLDGSQKVRLRAATTWRWPMPVDKIISYCIKSSRKNGTFLCCCRLLKMLLRLSDKIRVCA